MNDNLMTDERMMINQKIQDWKADVKKHAHPIHITTNIGVLYVTVGVFNYEIKRTTYITRMGMPCNVRKYYLLTCHTDEGEMVMDYLSISFNALLEILKIDIYHNVLDIEKI